MIRFFDIDTWNGNQIVIFGAGKYGRIVGEILQEKNIDFLYCDSNPDLDSISGKPCVSVDYLKNRNNIDVIIGSYKYLEDIYNILDGIYGNENSIFLADNLLRDYKWEKTNKIDNVAEHISFRFETMKFLAHKNEGWYLPHLDLIITEICTLNCKYCGSLMPYYTAPRNFQYDLTNALDELLSSNCYVGELDIVGGEPLVNPRVIEHICDTYSDCERIGVFEMITNGTIVPDKSVVESFGRLKDKYVLFSNYGELSTNQGKAVELFESFNINVAVLEDEDIDNDGAREWIFYGKVQHYPFSNAKHQKMYENCHEQKYCTTLLHDRLYRCPRMAHSVNSGLVGCETLGKGTFELMDDDFRLLSVSKKRDALLEWYNEPNHPLGCEYCNRDAGILVERALQEKRCRKQ